MDYILAHVNWKKCNSNARIFSETLTNSDHRLVITTVKLNWRTIHYKSLTNKNITVEHLRKSETQQRFKELVSKGIASVSKGTNQDLYL